MSGTEHDVLLTVDGSAMRAMFDMNRAEHRRRQRVNVGAITSTELLTGLWMLPTGFPTTPEQLPDIKVERLRNAPYAARETDGGFERIYAAPGVVKSVTFKSGKNIDGSIQRAINFTPIVQRFVIVDQTHLPLSSRIKAVACEWGIGIITGTPTETLVEADVAVIGVPSVYRWWIAELAYASYLRQTLDS